MTHIEPSAHPFDKYLFSLLELLRTKYFNVSVNRGSKTYTFFYSDQKENHRLTIPGGELSGYYMMSETPKQILDLLNN